MGRFNASEIDNYGNNSSSSYFSLSDDGECAQVRFMYNTADDIEGYAVHEIMIGDKKRYVNCIRSYNEPKHNCPLCAANNFQRAKLYVPLYVFDNKGNGEVKLWERGKKFFSQLSAICARYTANNTPLVSHTFDIERHGHKGDTQTRYDIFETGRDDTRLEDLPEIPEVLGTVILDKSYDELAFYAENGYFEDSDDSDRSDSRSDSMPTGRRTPANTTSRRRGDAF